MYIYDYICNILILHHLLGRSLPALFPNSATDRSAPVRPKRPFFILAKTRSAPVCLSWRINQTWEPRHLKKRYSSKVC